MTAGQYFALSLPLSTLLLATGFGACWRWRPQQGDLLWMAACFVLFSAGLGGQILRIPVSNDDSAVVSAALYHGAIACLAQAMCQRYRVRMAALLGGAMGLMALLVLTYFAYVDEQLYIRIYVLNFGLGLQLGLSTWRLWRLPRAWRRGESPTPHGIDRAVLLLFAVFVWSFLVRTVLTIPPADQVEHHTLGQTTFWIVLQLSLLVFALMFAMLYLAAAVRAAMVQLEEERNRDPLTQLLNRRAFLEALEHGDQRQSVGSVLVCDVDHFKRVNDRWGHAAGDTVLQSFARVLQESVRDGDLVARFGGEEFVLLLYGMPPEAAVQVAERIRQRLQHLHFVALPSGQRVTASFGVAPVECLPQLHQAIAHADRLLYEAKEAGRDCVRWEPTAQSSAVALPS